MAVCQYHKDRPAVGVCMRCRAAICTACCTRVDGINHCHACLRKLASRAVRPPRGRAPAALAAAVVLGLAWLFFVGVCLLVQGRLAP
jgi:hypothetical protein